MTVDPVDSTLNPGLFALYLTVCHCRAHCQCQATWVLRNRLLTGLVGQFLHPVHDLCVMFWIATSIDVHELHKSVELLHMCWPCGLLPQPLMELTQALGLAWGAIDHACSWAQTGLNICSWDQIVRKLVRLFNYMYASYYQIYIITCFMRASVHNYT